MGLSYLAMVLFTSLKLSRFGSAVNSDVSDSP